MKLRENLLPTLLVLTVLLAAPALLLAAEKKSEPQYQDDPTSSFEQQEIEGWKVYVHKKLLGERKEIGDRAVQLLRVQLQLIVARLPEAPLAEMRKVTIWLDDNKGAAQYHPDRGWLIEHGVNPDKAKAVDLRNPQTFVDWHRDQPWMVLHELAHAYHDQVLGFDDPRIRDAYDRAVAAQSYEEVLHCSGKKVKHYALSNHKEYFAEATEAFFGTNDFYPFVRAELAEHDPHLHQLLKSIWLGE